LAPSGWKLYYAKNHEFFRVSLINRMAH